MKRELEILNKKVIDIVIEDLLKDNENLNNKINDLGTELMEIKERLEGFERKYIEFRG